MYYLYGADLFAACKNPIKNHGHVSIPNKILWPNKGLTMSVENAKELLGAAKATRNVFLLCNTSCGVLFLKMISLMAKGYRAGFFCVLRLTIQIPFGLGRSWIELKTFRRLFKSSKQSKRSQCYWVSPLERDCIAGNERIERCIMTLMTADPILSSARSRRGKWRRRRSMCCFEIA